MTRGWIGVDLDGTLAVHDGGQGIGTIGEPIPAMIERIKKALADGFEVRILTARVAADDTRDIRRQLELIYAWLEKTGLPHMRVTCRKDMDMVELWDDRAKRVVRNTGTFAEEELEEYVAKLNEDLVLADAEIESLRSERE